MSDIVDRLHTDVLWHRRRGNETIAADCEEAAAELEALRKDAERYRWLRDPNNMRARELFRYYGDVDATELDAAIDAAMSTGATHEQ